METRMILAKGKHNFWSQLLLSMIAILALPQVQGLPNHSDLAKETYQNAQSIQQKRASQQALVQQIQLVYPSSSKQVQVAKIAFLLPHFYALFTATQPPIRAGPLY